MSRFEAIVLNGRARRRDVGVSAKVASAMQFILAPLLMWGGVGVCVYNSQA
jgi:hypothetical protein